MNYYQENLKDTSFVVGQLSALHDGLFCRLKRRYFHHEVALPNDLAQLEGWVGARTRAERLALQEVLESLFVLADDGRWHVEDWDEQIAEYQRGEPARAARRAEAKKSEDERLARYRAEHARLRAALADAGVKAKHNIGMPALRALCEKHLGGVPATGAETDPATPLQRPATRNQKPETSTQKPTHTPDLGVPAAGVGGVEEEAETPPATAETALQVEPARAAADALTAAGLRVHHTDTDLQALLVAGWSAADILAAGPKSGWKGIVNPCAWLVAKLGNKHAGGASAPPVASQQPATDWTATRSGIEAKGEELGLGRWNENDLSVNRETFAAYTGRVMRAAGLEARQAA